MDCPADPVLFFSSVDVSCTRMPPQWLVDMNSHLSDAHQQKHNLTFTPIYFAVSPTSPQTCSLWPVFLCALSPLNLDTRSTYNKLSLVLKREERATQ